MISRVPIRAVKYARPLARRSPFCVRFASSQNGSPSSKITTAPFRLSPGEALEKMHINALLASGKLASIPNIVYAFFLRFFGPSVTPIAREFGFGEKLELKDMKAALYPVWRVDGVAEGKVDIVHGEGQNQLKSPSPTLSMSVTEGYVPGNPFAPLSYLSFAVPPLYSDLPEYNPSKDHDQLKDYGLDIVPIPFTVSPLGLVNHIRRLIDKKTWDHWKIDEKKIEEKMLACYPIMFPIYIAEFEYDQGEDGKRRFNVFMDAHDESVKTCRVSWPPPPHLIEEGRFDRNYFVNPAPFMPTSTIGLYPLPPTPRSALIAAQRTRLPEVYGNFMSPPPDLDDPSQIPPSPMYAVQQAASEGEGIDWEDERIMSWSGVGREENGDWMELYEKTQKGIETLETMRSFSSNSPHPEDLKGLVITSPLERRAGHSMIERKSLKDMEDQLERDVKRMKRELEESKPAWLRAWELEQKGDSK
ncbi:hypothetical protein I350_02486 [Cryptococcus amylolentus CBS 6273]|uniref:Uncharacterized protein n=1 Tax=Cryptococcus amylolentus CBS 6273 TaxID=1296118 RepID=A0A1E3KCE4_9TREE|nr:hypothetical protein I350_02486 [Cryptococcus amylolentus CBS 6273]